MRVRFLPVVFFLQSPILRCDQLHPVQLVDPEFVELVRSGAVAAKAVAAAADRLFCDWLLTLVSWLGASTQYEDWSSFTRVR